MSITNWAKNKKFGGRRVKSLPNRCNETTAVVQKKYNKKVETMLAKQNYSLLIWNRSLKSMLQHPTMWFDWKQSKYPSKETAFMRCFCTSKSTDVWKTVTNSACRPLRLYQKTRLWKLFPALVILEIDLTSELLRYVPLTSGTLWKVLFWTVWNLRWLPTL